MFRTKKDVDRHVTDILSKIHSENEKNFRGYTFARLYFQAKDFETAKRYLSGFLKVRDHNAPAHKLMGQIHEVNQNLENALHSYKRSLDIDPHQNEVVLKICELYCRLPVDHETARYWADRAEDLYPHNEIVFKLRECLVSADGEADHQELEKLIATELQAQPKNISLRIKLLRLYLDTERLTEAYDHSTMIESKRLFPWSVEWYYLLGDIFEAYQEENSQNLDSQFYIQYLTALDRLVLLTLAEPHSLSSEDGRKHYSVNDAAAVLLTFDQVLKSASEKDLKDGWWKYFIHHMKGQLYFYMASLLLKRTKLDQGNRKEAFRFSSGLAVVCYTFKPMNLLQEIWFLQMDENQKTFANFFQQGSLRTSFIGHVIIDMCKEDKSKWLQKLKLDVCLTQVKERIYSRVFNSVIQKDKLLSSYFILDSTFEDSSLEFPSDVALLEYDKAAYKLCPDSLHHLVWFELHRRASSGPVFDDNLSEVFKGLQYSNKNLSKGSCESLCVLDLEAYLFASVYQAQAILDKKKALLYPKIQSSQLSYPPDIADAMCSKQQASWWRAAHGLHSCSVKDKFSEFRRELQRGLEVIRGIGNHGMEIQLILFLARIFADKAEFFMKDLGSRDNKRQLIPENVTALQLRSLHYWKIALGMLDKLSGGQTLGVPKEQMFAGFNQVLSKSDITALQEEGKLYVAVHLMNSDKLDEAAELLSTLSTPYGSYYLALTLKRLASQEEHFSKTRTALLTRAKNSVHETMDRTKDDKCHPLNQELYVILEDVENELATDLSISNSHDNEDIDEIDAYTTSPELNSSLYMTPNSNRSTSHSTPRPSSKFMSTRPKSQPIKQEPHQHFEPSPERLDAQIRALTLNQDTFVKTFLEQQKSFLETNKSIAVALQQNTEVLEQLKKSIDELKISGARNQKGSSRKHSYNKGQGDEDDYSAYDPNLLEFYSEDGNEDYRASTYSYNPSTRMVHDAAAPLNYVMSSAIPPGPPPALNHYNYQYPHHPVLPAPPVAERSFYHPPPGQGLPFSEGQQLPQFHFHVASPVVKPTPPIMSSVASLPQGVTLPPPPPPPVHPSQSVIPPSAMTMPSPWSKTVSVPHAFQIPLPASTPFPPAAAVVSQQTVAPISNPSSISPHSDLKSLLKSSPAQEPISFSQNISATPITSASNVSIFAGICKTPEFAKLERSRCDSDNGGSPDIDGHDLEREVMGDFKPLIPLPAEIVVETGEENEVVLFEDRAKLYRYVDQEWKERGIGIVKILHDDTSGRVRLLMRRDQVLKVCANHCLTSNMDIQPLKSSDRAWTWLAQDFADEELRPEHFCIRFKTVELAIAFKAAFDKALTLSKESEKKKLASPHTSIPQTDAPSSLKPFGANLFPKAGSWSCSTCYVSNASDKLSCVACESKKPGSQIVTDSSSPRIYPINTSDSSMLPSVQNPLIPFKIGSNENQFVFGTPISVNSDIFSSKSTTVPTNTPKSTFGGFTFTSSPTIRETETPEVKDREILVVSTKSKNGLQVTKVNQLNSSPFSNFSFVKSPPTSTTTSPALSVQFSDNVRNVSIKNATSASDSTVIISAASSTATAKISDNKNLSSTLATPVTPSTARSSGIQSATTKEGSLSKMQSMIQNINPTYVFSQKDSSSTNASDEPQKTTSPFLPKSFVNTGRLPGEGEPEEFVPTAEFKPVVPLPALVDLKTGEEGEEKVFGERAKLFRFDLDSKEWKERGIGELKILYQKESDKYRILMRRDVILKLCANHCILPEMKLSPLSNNDKSWVWFAQDYSDGDLKQEQFAARFKTTEIARKFYEVFQKCQCELGDPMKMTRTDKPSTDSCAGNAQAFEQLLKPKVDSWECSNCHKRYVYLPYCISCKISKDDSANSVEDIEQKPLSELFKPVTGSWECQICYVRNKSSDNKCVSCESQKPGSVQDLKQSDSKAPLIQDQNKSLAEMFKPEPGSWECQICLVRNIADKTKCSSCESDKDGISSTESKPFGTFTLASSSTPNPSPFTFGTPKADTGDFVFGVRPVIQPTTFSFGHSTVKTNSENQTVGFKPSLPTSNVPAVFGGITQNQSNETNNTSNSIFGSSSTTKFDFSSYASLQKTDGESQEFRFGSPQKYEFNFQGVRPRSPAKTPKSPRSPATPSDVDDEDVDSDADNIYFQPAIPLPPKINVKTGEEDEKTLFCKRAKLFRFSSGEWKERGIGDIKMLLDEKTNRHRLLMRREQVLKVCLNHYLSKDITFEWRGEKSLSWTATDFSENEPSPELLAIRFKTSELAKDFKSAIASALEKTKESLPQNNNTLSNSASSFSFKTDSPKVESNFCSGSLSSRFGISMQEKSLFGNTSFGDSKEPSIASPFSNIFKNKPTTSSFFGQPNNSIFDGSKPSKDGVKFLFGSKTEENTKYQDVKVVYESTASEEQIERAKKLRLPKNFYLFEDKAASCPGCIGCNDIIPPYKDITIEEPKVEEALCLEKESSEQPAASESNELFCNSKLTTFSFTDLATTGSFENLTKSSPTGKNAFAGAGTPIFSNLNSSTGDGNEDVSQGPDIHFEPVIPLPDLIEVKTGEEDETELFVQRAKLFRFDPNTKQWKERGIGDIKILRHKHNLRFRIILRRDQVHNIACNHCISEEMSLTPLATSETALCWNALDFSDGKGVASQFAVRFKHKEQMIRFKKIFTECQEMQRIGKQLAEVSETGNKDAKSEIIQEQSENTASNNEVNSANIPGEKSNNEVDHGTEDQNSDRGSEDEEDEEILFEKRASLEILEDATSSYKNEGVGSLKITYDDAVYGYHISMINDHGKILCDHIIAVQTCLRIDGKKAIWAAIDLSSDPPVRRNFRATFCSKEAANEFQKYFEEGKEIAIESIIVENTL